MTNNKIKMNPDQCRALAHLSTKEVDREKRSVPVLLSTGQRGVRFDFWTGERYFEELEVTEQAVRLRESVPLLDEHEVSNRAHLGIVRNLHIRNGELRGDAFFDKHPLALQRFESVAEGFIEDNSVGYRVYKYDRIGEAPDPFDASKKIAVMRAVDWEPRESSLVPIGFDSDAKFNRSASDSSHSIEINVTSPQNSEKNEKVRAKMEENETTTAPAAAPAPIVDMQKIREEAAAAERTRVSEILITCRGVKKEDLATDYIARGLSVADVNADLIRQLASSNYRPEAPVTTSTSSGVSVGKSHDEKRDEGMYNALLNRANGSMYELNDNGRRFRGWSLVDFAREFSDIKNGSADQIVKRAFMTTSNFKLLLNNVAERTLQDQFRSVPRTFEPFVRRGLVNDFKPVGRMRLTDMSGLIKIPEHAEFKAGEITDAEGQPIRVETYGRKFSLTRQAITNDDLGAFQELPAMIGRKAATLESKLVYSIIKSNPVMNDGYAFFSAAHGNLAPTPAALSDESLTAALLSFRSQTTEDDEEFIDVSPRYILVPPALEGAARRLMSVVNPTEIGQVNLYAGAFEIIVEPRLSAAAGGSDTAWYLVPSKNDIESIEIANLRGAETLQIEQIEAEDILGITWRAYYDVGCSAIEWRGMFKNAGA